MEQEDLRLNPAGADFASINNAGLGPALDSDVPKTDILGNPRSGLVCCMGSI